VVNAAITAINLRRSRGLPAHFTVLIFSLYDSFGIVREAEVMAESVAGLGAPEMDAGLRLSLKDYALDFVQRRYLADGVDCWKLERAQHFTETGFPSFEAFVAGDWQRAMDLYADLRGELASLADEQESHGSQFHRVRIVAEPLSPYMIWELHCFRIRAERLEKIHVVPAELVRDLEANGPLPELVTLCGQTLYRVMYTEDGTPDGAVRFTDPGVITAYEELIRSLYEVGEDFTSYFDRRVAHLPVPGLYEGR
jgi:hypothetical protein